MGEARKRLVRRKEARDRLEQVLRQPDLVNIIHYSCESFRERPDGTSPRVTSIAVRHVGSRQTVSFSIHQIAEERHIGKDAIPAQYDVIERHMLDRFAEYVDAHKAHRWVHWNMRDTNYGFLAIEHRHRVLGGEPLHISEDRLLDLAATFVDMYGRQYASHPRLENVMKLNNISSVNFLPGVEEALAFERRDYVSLHLSTLSKVDVLHNLAVLAAEDSLQTNASLREQYGATIQGFVEVVTDHWLFKVLGFIGIVGSIVGVILVLWHP